MDEREMQGYRNSDGGVLRCADGADSNLTDVERLAVAQAFQNVVGKLTKTGIYDNLRGRVDDYFIERYLESGAKSFDVKLLGKKVGTYSLTVTEETEPRKENQLVVKDKGKLMRWALENGFVKADMVAIDAYFHENGEVPDGCLAEEITVAGDAGGMVKRTTLRIDEEKAAQVMGNQLGAYAQNLLEGGRDD